MNEMFDIMMQLESGSKKAIELVDSIKDYDKSVALAIIGTAMDEYCKINNYDLESTWKNLYEVSHEIHEIFHD